MLFPEMSRANAWAGGFFRAGIEHCTDLLAALMQRTTIFKANSSA
jgi:hypothetical protein